jgi:hypothetical protein
MTTLRRVTSIIAACRIMYRLIGEKYPKSFERLAATMFTSGFGCHGN